MTALQSLNATNKNLEKTQSRISTGFKVNEAADNAAYWAIATTLRSDNSALSTVQDSLGLGAGQVDVSYTAVSNTIEIVKQIRDKLASARQDTVDKKLVQTDIDALQEQLLTVAKSASYSGQNWLMADAPASAGGTAQIVASYSRNSLGSSVIGHHRHRPGECSPVRQSQRLGHGCSRHGVRHRHLGHDFGSDPG